MWSKIKNAVHRDIELNRIVTWIIITNRGTNNINRIITVSVLIWGMHSRFCLILNEMSWLHQVGPASRQPLRDAHWDHQRAERRKVRWWTFTSRSQTESCKRWPGQKSVWMPNATLARDSSRSCGFGLSQGPHVVLWSLSCAPRRLRPVLYHLVLLRYSHLVQYIPSVQRGANVLP